MLEQHPPRGMTRRVDAGKLVAYGAYLAFHVVSLLTTTYGMAAVLDIDDSVVGWLVPFLASLAVQATIGWSGHMVRDSYQERRWDRLGASAAVLCLVVSISIGFAYGFWFHLVQADRYARDVAVVEVDKVIQPVQVFSQRLTDASEALGQLVTYSEERAATERAQGGTCQLIGPGGGPRTRRREADARMFGSMAEGAQRAADNAQAHLDALRGYRESYMPAQHDEHVAGVNQVLANVRPLIAADHGTTAGDLRARIELGRSEMRDDPTGQSFRCPDSELERLVRAVLAPLENLQTVRDEVPSELVFHRPDNLASLGVAYHRLRSLVGFGTSADDGPSSGEDILPLLAAVVVDGVIFLTPFAWQSKRRAEKSVGVHDYFREFSELLEAPPDPGAATDSLVRFSYEHHKQHTLYDLFGRFLIQRRRYDEVVLPVGGVSLHVEALRRVLDALGRRRYVRRQRVTQRLRRELPCLQADTEYVAIYRFKPGLMQALARERIRQSCPSPADAPLTDAKAGHLVANRFTKG